MVGAVRLLSVDAQFTMESYIPRCVLCVLPLYIYGVLCVCHGVSADLAHTLHHQGLRV